MANSSQTIKQVSSFDESEIRIDPARVLAPVDPKIYSGFLEHLGRCIYGGIVDYGNAKLTNDKGFRLDVCQALKDLDMPVVRWPGGNFVSSYHWVDGIGPKEDRPRRPELAWLGEESNVFGTDEFMEWCEYMNVEPYICLNMGTGTLDEALAWIEYCNSDRNTYYANLRRKNGREKPYNVKYWGLGNEVYGPWQVGQMSKEDYSKQAFQWAKAIRLLDPTVKLIGCGCTGFDDWDRYVTNELIKSVDYHSIHLYTCHQDYYKNVTGPAAAERGIQIAKNMFDLAKITQNAPDAPMKICFDEWNVWDPVRADGSKGAEEQYDLSDALAVASWCNVFVRQAESVGMANIAQCVNVIAPIMTSPDGLFLQTTYFPFRLFSNYMRGNSLNVHVSTPVYHGETDGNNLTLKWLKGVEPNLTLLDVSAVAKVENGQDVLYVAVVNRSETDDATTAIKVDGTVAPAGAYRWTLYHDNIRATNTFASPNEVAVTEEAVSFANGSKVAFPKHSFTLLKIALA
ncbi:glycoside hydrolase superfamily [Dipodascopsis tothii]|uniref:glycoside hydrolase superfamily n=1 Tax=Dipodascopsis tothii TaxID=44089 RepID=UPI0034CD5749